eukprot:CAMPEP_0170522258 /NCGR_PEP_ID=MMETSP0209-20121228/7711_1 /TAXON_ID=665100 ORGANISM="Litonotus pictus, Strain P1" /NCGR_SAMPLE_ID=MMETSP0209 /ASSEMBLY_ACC=CAM_ASM_000301 /LENGTH=722 /DNA_ID=CAMNT_0010809689 /DNA_START=99 /DNA_END=2263 /DNA_ORIENTATION=-
MEEIAKLNVIGEDYTASPDGHFAVYSVRTWSQNEENHELYYSYLQAKPLFSSEEAISITPKTESVMDLNPVFISSKENKDISFLVFLRNSKLRFIVYSSESKTFSKDTEIDYSYPVPILGFKAVENMLVFTSNVYPEFRSDLSKTVQKDKEEAPGKDYYLYSKLMLRFWNQWNTGKVTMIFSHKISLDITYKKIVFSSTGPMIRSGLGNNSTEKKFIYFSPFPDSFDLRQDGKELLFSASVNDLENKGSYDRPDLQDSKIYSVNIETEEETTEQDLKVISFNNRSRSSSPKYSPNGNSITFLSGAYSGIALFNSSFRLYEAGNIKEFPEFDYNIDLFTWFDDVSIIFTVKEDGISKFGYLRLDLPDAQPQILYKEQEVLSLHSPLVRVPHTMKVISMKSSMSQTAEMYIFNCDIYSFIYESSYPQFSLLTKTNEDISARLSKVVGHYYVNSSLEPIKYFLVLPLGFDSSKKYPLVLNIHGGPEDSFSDIWANFVLNPQLISGDKYITLLVNPHGSQGMGKDFMDKIRSNWGLAYTDLMETVQKVITKGEYAKNIEREQMCCMGLSFGGFSTNYIRGKLREDQEEGLYDFHFNCYVTNDGIFNIRNTVYSTDYPWFIQWEMCPQDNILCKPYEKEYKEYFDKFSPENYVNLWDSAAHLVIHSINDFRLTWSEGNALFNSLKLKGIKAKYLLFKKEGHVVSQYSNAVVQANTISQFIDENIKIT